jgi:tRNA nucleotidyltransferase (CCA-adding enzyme)
MSIDDRVVRIARCLNEANSRALIVGGWVRDRLLGIESKDVDVEVFGIELDALKDVLAKHGEIIEIGRAFGVLKVKGLDVDFSLPRTDSKTGPGHRGFDVETDPSLDFETAARRRDLTINSIGFDPLTDEYLDPHNGRKDLDAGVLRATDPAQFDEDPLRGLRVAQFSARFQMRADEQLLALAAKLDLSEVSPERVFEEFRKLLLKGQRPSYGFEFLRDSGLLRYFPELEALIDVPQDARWHPEGDVWVHTMMVIDEAAGLRDEIDDLALMFGALCHDLGKPDTTEHDAGTIRSHGHDTRGVRYAESFMSRLRAPKLLTEQVKMLVHHHLAPTLFVQQNAKPTAYKRLARKLEPANVSMSLLARVARADHLGRTTLDSKRRLFQAGDVFLEISRECSIEHFAPKDLVLGRHLLDRGLEPGKRYGWILARCRELQDEQNWDDANALVDEVLDELGIHDSGGEF